MLKSAFAALAVTTAALAAPAHALTFADYTPVGTAANFQWTQSTPVKTGGSLKAIGDGVNSTDVRFDFIGMGLASNLAAKLTLTGFVPLGNPAIVVAGFIVQPNVDDNFSIIYTGPTMTFDGKTYVHDVSNLLSGSFTSGAFSGASGSSAGALTISSSAGGMVTFTSDYISSFDSSENGVSLALTSITPHLKVNPGQSLSSFKAVSAGSFETAAVPEPTTWALMLVGFGSAGAMLRTARRQRASA